MKKEGKEELKKEKEMEIEIATCYEKYNNKLREAAKNNGLFCGFPKPRLYFKYKTERRHKILVFKMEVSKLGA